MPPYRTSVVRLVAYRKEEFLDRHQPHAPPPADPRPFIFLLAPDSLQLVTACEAGDGGPAAGASLLQQASSQTGERTPRRAAVRPLALLHKLAAAGPGGAGGEGGGTATLAEDAACEGLGGELEDGQLLTFSIALSQIMFCRQRPHRSTESNDDWKAVWKAMAFPVAYPVESLKHRNFSVKGFLNRHYRDPFVSSVVLEADSPQEAARLHCAIESAIGRLAEAVQWLAQDLPLDSKPVVALVTLSAPDGAAGAAPGGGGEAASPPLASPGPPTSQSGQLERIVCAFPRLRQPLDIPAAAAAAGTATGGGEVEGAARTAAGGSGSGGADLSVHVWLHSPLGPAVATITQHQLRQSAEGGGAPVCVTATPHEAQGREGAGGGTPQGRDTLEVILQFTATWRPATRRLTGGPPPPAAGGLHATLAVLAVPLLAAWLQLAHSSMPAIQVLHSVAFLLSCLAAMVAIVTLQLKGRATAPPATPPGLEAPQVAGWWRLVLLHADLVRESRQDTAAGAPAVQRLVSSSHLSTRPSAMLPLDGGAVELPPPIRRLVDDHPRVLTLDIAARFLVGLGHLDKAYQALSSMVEWVEAQGVADLVHQAQPRFEVIKQHYPQVFYCWSRSADCVLEVECTGQWRAAFEALRALGVTERELLRHQFFTMEYAFRVLDTRPLPQGKTVKIIDLEGLTIRDVSSAAFKWYLQVGGALLAVNYPQRLHKAFLLNAPAWSGVIWKVLAAVIPRRTREQLQLFTRKQRPQAAQALLQWVPADQLPERYGGSCVVPLGESELERQMLAYVRGLNEAAAAAVVSHPVPAAELEAAK